jgi:DNA-directed RNA polymerase specialized sigma24 family protein
VVLAVLHEETWMNKKTDMDAPPCLGIDQYLQTLALASCQYPAQSSQRQRVLNQLVKEVLRSRRLAHPQQGLWISHVYEELYNEALQRTLLEVCQKIDRYDPRYPVLAWVNFLLRYHFSDVAKEHRNWRIAPLSMDELDCFFSTDRNSFNEAPSLREFLEEDPENQLKTPHIKGRSEVTFQVLALARFVEDQSWEQLSTELGISIQTLCSFFNRQLRKLAPYFEKYLQE